MSTAATDISNRTRFSEQEWQTRVDLAACHRLAARFGFDEIVWNHISARVPETDNFLINRFGLRFDEITASNLVTINQAGEVLDGPKDINVTAYVIHHGIYAARSDINCVMHSHSRGGLAVSALECGLLPVMQGAFMFHNRVAYHDYEGISDDPDESTRLAKSLGEHNAMILRNHGLITVGSTVGQAFVQMFYLEQACKTQIDVMSTGAKLALPDDEIMEHAAQQQRHFAPGKFEWPALLRMLDDTDPSYKE
ncbi:MAG: class II aldolase/adducin family protein [Gammaproteobacteria bacterium]|nr:class II aldolase/adducin family protein [Gammaproteobacteria bacterium]